MEHFACLVLNILKVCLLLLSIVIFLLYSIQNSSKMLVLWKVLLTPCSLSKIFPEAGPEHHFGQWRNPKFFQLGSFFSAHKTQHSEKNVMFSHFSPIEGGFPFFSESASDNFALSQKFLQYSLHQLKKDFQIWMKQVFLTCDEIILFLIHRQD